MKAIILAGGLGTRISEETDRRPKPMIEIGNKPILWHIMKIYSFYGVNEFVICTGYKGYSIKEYFMNYFFHQSDVTFDLKNNSSVIHSNNAEDWKVTVVNTGELNMTGSRIKQVRQYVENDDFFCLTYGDGVSDINIGDEIAFHKKHGKIATLAAVKPGSRFGVLDIKNDTVVSFKEKPKEDSHWISGGFFVLSPKVFDYIDDSPDCIFEKYSLLKLSRDKQLMPYYHTGFWQPMDTLRDKNALEGLWISKKAKWKVW